MNTVRLRGSNLVNAKLLVVITVLVCSSLLFYTNFYAEPVFTIKSQLYEVDVLGVPSEKPLKYILQWTSPNDVPFVYMGKGQQGFISRNCKYTNCYVTSDRNYFKDYTEFDVIALSGTDVAINFYLGGKMILPERRSPHQKYAFASIESSENYPICDKRLNGFFNWTWTYKLNSDARWGYFDIRDSHRNVVGPKTDMTWLKPDDMLPVSGEMRRLLDNKTKTVAWFVSNCASNRRKKFVDDLEKELKSYNLTVDVYGQCGTLKCGRDKEKECDDMMQREYHFYLAFENSFSEDYVTEKVLHAVEYTTVPALPVFFSGANLTRFMPPGSYLDARELGPQKLAAKMNELVNDKNRYAEYFRWVNHYTYARQSASPETDEYCGFCTLLNDEERVKKKSVYEDFIQWWTPDDSC